MLNMKILVTKKTNFKIYLKKSLNFHLKNLKFRFLNIFILIIVRQLQIIKIYLLFHFYLEGRV